MIGFHYDTSTVTIDGESFPACALICPQPAPDRDMDPAARLLGQPWLKGPLPQADMLVYVPMENGALVEVSGVLTDKGPVYTVMVTHPSCRRSDGPAHDWMWMPVALEVAKGSGILRPDQIASGRWRSPRSGTSIWVHAEEDWVAEFIPRLARRRVDPPCPEGPRARLIRLDEMAVLWREVVTV